ncbi:IS66 family transposase [Pseudogemmobacter humi]|uniref:Transposase IS66 family protein n=1 Tax=Pseudogemmobacter humi TaxID=2483812 RepID=A0A3P5X653_9RHOB|nr:transposase [Pseudogemmobacter humi]VDC23739.1 Transposase IS66 family protein [Pseudogemmobacter humi]
MKDVLDGASTRFLATDGHGGYNQLFRKPGTNEGMYSARCWAHARRKFFETCLATKSPQANKIVKLIRKMYAVEKAARGLPPEEREKLRQEKSRPALTGIRTELERNAPKASGLMKQAINYTLKAFDALQQFIFDGRIEIETNAVERCIRSIALTKKNSLFAGNHQAAKVWAILYRPSGICSC